MSIDLAINCVVDRNRPDFLIKLLPLGDVFFLNRLKSRAKAYRHHEVLALLEDPRLAKPASVEDHLIHKPDQVCIGCLRGVFAMLFLFSLFQLVSELIHLDIPQD